MQLSPEEIRTQITLFLSKLGGDRGSVDISDYEFAISHFAEIELNPKSINELDEGVYQFNGKAKVSQTDPASKVPFQNVSVAFAGVAFFVSDMDGTCVIMKIAIDHIKQIKA